jgi:hypothetical protein
VAAALIGTLTACIAVVVDVIKKLLVDCKGDIEDS